VDHVAIRGRDLGFLFFFFSFFFSPGFRATGSTGCRQPRRDSLENTRTPGASLEPRMRASPGRLGVKVLGEICDLGGFQSWGEDDVIYAAQTRLGSGIQWRSRISRS
jgi:hypothetical protein